MFFTKKINKEPLWSVKKKMTASKKFNFDFAGFSKHNIFNKISDKSEFGYFYFPYNYMVRHVKWGVLNKLGFRDSHEISDIKKVFPKDYIIALYGGSTGFSTLVPFEKSFGFLIQEKLNNDKDFALRKVKVVNFSQLAANIPSHIINFILFSHLIEPHLVLNHLGMNDLIVGQTNDPYLLKNYEFTYEPVFEVWARHIHENYEFKLDYDYSVGNSENFVPLTAKNNPETIIKAFINRILQFKSISESQNSIYCGGFQPWIYSKRNLSKKEGEAYRNQDKWRHDIYKNAEKLYDDFEIFLENKKPNFIINLHKEFKNKSRDEVTYFGDVCHSLEEGDELISDIYVQYLKKIILNDPAYKKN